MAWGWLPHPALPKQAMKVAAHKGSWSSVGKYGPLGMQRFDPVFVCRSLVKRLLVEDEEPIVGLAAVDCWLLFLPPPSPRFGCTLDPVQTHDATLLAQRSDTPGRVVKYDAFPVSVDVHVVWILKCMILWCSLVSSFLRRKFGRRCEMARPKTQLILTKTRPRVGQTSPTLYPIWKLPENFLKQASCRETGDELWHLGPHLSVPPWRLVTGPLDPCF